MKIAKLTAKRIFGFSENSQCCQWRPGQTEEIKSDTRHKTFPLSYTLYATTTQAAIELRFSTRFLSDQLFMEEFKTPQVFHPSQFSSAIFSVSLAICFVALIHVEIELHVHRQMLQVLNQEREDSIQLRKVVDGHEKTIDSVLKKLQSGSPTGNCILIKLSLVFNFSQFLTSICS